MSLRHARSPRPAARRGTAAIAALAALSVAVAGCTASSAGGQGSPDPQRDTPSAPSAPPVSQASVATNFRDGAGNVRVDKVVELAAREGSFDKVRVTVGSGKKRLQGRLSDDRTRWTATQRLEPGARYQVRADAVDSDGLAARETTAFRTDDLTLDEQTFPSIAPLEGETVGVGMPAIVAFDVPVTDRAAVERHLSVETSPEQIGAWHWISDNEVHWRPKTYWQPGTEVTVNADINSVDAGDGIYGQLSRSTSFTVGDSVVSEIDVAAHQMKVYVNGALSRTIAISAGKPGFTTRSGTKVIIEKFREKRMNSETIGISESDPEYYDIDDVEYAMRVTYSGEFLHAAPWSVGSQGSANVSHGCVGMSTEDAAWLYNITKRGDVVEVTGTDRDMTLTNGYGDWNASFAEYRQGSALS